MTIREGTKFRRKPYTGPAGDSSVFTSQFVAQATPIGDVIRFAQMPAGCEIIDVRLINDALGAATTLSLGYEYVDSTIGAAAPAAFAPATATATAGKITTAFHPQLFNDDIVMTATIGGGAITGTVSLLVNYRFIGTM